MGCLTVVRALLVRFLFACHGVLAIWLLHSATKDSRYWYLSLAIAGLFIETLVTLCKKRGQEWKWFCPSVLFYLLSVVPAIWFLELRELEKRLNGTDTVRNSSGINSTDSEHEGLRAVIATGIKGLNINIIIPIRLSANQWIKFLEQVLLLLLIIGRWILPKGKLTHDQLSQLLLVYIGTAADIVEFFDAFKEKKVSYDWMLCVIILAIWSWSLLQFTMVLTATRARKDQSGLIVKINPDKRNACCTPDVYGIIISILMQDAPFLVLRLLLIFKYDVLSYTNMFFTSKNTLVIVLLIYRLVVVQCTLRKEYKKMRKEEKNKSQKKSTAASRNKTNKNRGHRLNQSSSRQKLLLSQSDTSSSLPNVKSPNGVNHRSSSRSTGSCYDNMRHFPNKSQSSYEPLRVLPRRDRDRFSPGYSSKPSSCYVVSETSANGTTANRYSRSTHTSDPSVDRPGHHTPNFDRFDRFYTPHTTPPIDQYHTPATSPRLSRIETWRNSLPPSTTLQITDPEPDPAEICAEYLRLQESLPPTTRPPNVAVSNPWTRDVFSSCQSIPDR